MSTKRQYPRYPVRKIVSYTCDAKRCLTLTANLSLGGMKIETGQCFNRGERLLFRLVLGRDFIMLEGMTRYSQMFSGNRIFTGIQFIKIPTRNRNLLEEYLATLEDRPLPSDMFFSESIDEVRRQTAGVCNEEDARGPQETTPRCEDFRATAEGDGNGKDGVQAIESQKQASSI